jgi:hypothetical protein
MDQHVWTGHASIGHAPCRDHNGSRQALGYQGTERGVSMKRELAELFGLEGLTFVEACLMILVATITFVSIWFFLFLIISLANMAGIN